MVASRKNFTSNLTIDEIKNWHSLLFDYDHKMNHIGEWRAESDDPMQIVSGPFGAEIVHFDAPPAATLEQEMRQFVLWFNNNLIITLPFHFNRFSRLYIFRERDQEEKYINLS